MIKEFFIRPIRESRFSAIIVAILGISIGAAWSLNGADYDVPSVWKFILSAEFGAVCLLASWIAFSAFFGRVFKSSKNSARKIEAVAHLPALFYSFTGVNIILHIQNLGYNAAMAAVLMFGAAKISETIYFKFPRKAGAFAGISLFIAAMLLVSVNAERSVFGKNEYWRDREAIPFKEEPPAFTGPGAARVFVNTAGQWRPATKIKGPGVYEFRKKLDYPSRLSIGFLSVSPRSESRAEIILNPSDSKPYRINLAYRESGWKDVDIEKIMPAGEVSVRIVLQAGEMWVSDPVWTWGFDRVNILLIVIDTLRADHLSCYGYPRRTTPVIDKISETGAVFEHHYSASSWSSAAVGSIFTGLYPRQHGCIDFGSIFLSLDLETFAESLRQAGYRTVGVSGNPLLSLKTGFAQGFDRFNEDCLDRVNWRSGECMTENGINTVGGGSPTFLYMQYMDPHMPYLAPPPELMRWRRWPYPAGPGKIREFLTNRYDEDITYCDREIGKLMDVLATNGFLKNAIVIITADHGDELGDHGGFNHGHNVFEEVIHVPMIISGVGIQHGVRINSLTSGVDIYPTLLHVAGIGTRPILPGKSLLPLSSLPVREWTLSDNVGQTALRTPRYKFIEDAVKNRRMLYDVNIDPFDSDDISKREPALTAEASRTLREILEELGRVKPPALRSRAVMIDLQNRLKALGYVK